jgi:hypothetical protein
LGKGILIQYTFPGMARYAYLNANEI